MMFIFSVFQGFLKGKKKEFQKHIFYMSRE